MEMENKVYKCFRIKQKSERKKLKNKIALYHFWQGKCKIGGKQYSLKLKGSKDTFFAQIDKYIEDKEITKQIEERLKDYRENYIFD